ncbi:TnsA endonuclease N-terminal domain-containing protein [Paraburkholderia nemoris]
MGREAQLPRDCLFAAFLWECYQDNTTDIRELMPCDHTDTVEVARVLKLRHPRNEDGTCKVLKADLLVTKREGRRRWVEAVSVRLQGGSPPAGQPELRIIEQFWKQQGVLWRLHLNDGLNTNWARNLDFLYAIALRPVRAGDGADSPTVQRAVMRALLDGQHMSVRTACEFAMKEKGLPVRFGLNAFHLLLAAKQIRFDVHCRDVDQEPVSALTIVDMRPIRLA